MDAIQDVLKSLVAAVIFQILIEAWRSRSRPIPSDDPGRAVRAGRFIRRAILDHWRLTIVVLTSANYIWEIFGPEAKDTWWWVSVLYALQHYFVDRPGGTGIKTTRHSNWIRFGLMLLTVLFLIRLCSALHNVLAPEMNFQYRADNLLDHKYRMYQSPHFLLPESIYGGIKTLLGKEFHEEMYDARNTYDQISVWATHMGDSGRVGYEYHGRSAGGKPAKFFHANFGEVANLVLCDPNGYFKLPEKVLMEPGRKIDFKYGRGSAILRILELPSAGFHYVRWFCAPECVTQADEFLAMDFANIEHLPNKVYLTFVSNEDLYDEVIYKLERKRNFFDWLFARPLYRQSVETLIGPIRPICEQDVESLKAVSDGFGRVGYEVDPSGLLCYQFELDTGNEPCIFLLRYRVNKHVNEGN